MLLSIHVLAQEKRKLEIPDVLKSIVPYGTFEYGFGGNKHSLSIVDLIPRIGLKGSWAFDENEEYSFFTKAEVSVKLSKKNTYIRISADPGSSPYGSPVGPFGARLGYIGISTPYGSVSIGKQWGVHYTLAGNIDNMYMFGGDAIGVYNAGTDGGSSGTGRADQSMKYEYTSDKFYIGVQSQFYDSLADSISGFGASSIASYYIIGNVKVGASYSHTFDGIKNPQHGESIYGDQYASLYVGYTKEDFFMGILASKFNQHEKYHDIVTGKDVYYDGLAIEYNLKYNFGKDKRWAFVQNSSINLPDADQNTKYVNNRYSFELARRFSLNTVVFAGFRFDNNTMSNGDKNYIHTVAIGLYYNFNYPVP